MSWMNCPLGIAVVDETPSGDLAVEHVSIKEDGATLSGAWLLQEPRPADLNNLLTQWIIIGTRGGIERVSKTLGSEIRGADLRDLVAACVDAEEAIVAAWQTYKDEKPKNRAHLVPVRAPSWPIVHEDGDASDILVSLGRLAVPSGCPDEMHDVLALARLVQYVVDCWQELETDRLSRRYLAALDATRSVLPQSWVDANPGHQLSL